MTLFFPVLGDEGDDGAAVAMMEEEEPKCTPELL